MSGVAHSSDVEVVSPRSVYFRHSRSKSSAVGRIALNKMPDERIVPDVTLNLPPHARIVKITFSAIPGTCRILLENGSEPTVAAQTVRSFHGARIPQHSFPVVPRRQRLLGPIEFDEVSHDSMVYAFAMRVLGAPALWYLIADSFDYRKTLGVEAANVSEKNLGLLIKRLVDFAPHARQDAFVRAFARSLPPLPPPVDTLMEFFWNVARNDPS